jgi:ABC-type sugar transport system ATPase subunit
VNASDRAPALEMRGIRKTFPGVIALDAVDLTVEAGDVHMLLGENGAGKSTLIRVLGGVHAPDRGEVSVAGQACRFSSPREAANCHLLFISSSEASRLASILEALENSSVMTVADIEGFSDRNGIIHFVDVPTKDGPAKIGFKINRKAAEKAKLRINSQLLARSSK